MKTYKVNVELEHNKGVKIKQVVLIGDYKKAVLEFEKELNDIDRRIDSNIYSYTDNKRFKYQRKVVLEIIKKFKVIFGDFNK